MWAHYSYLLMLPALAVLAAGKLHGIPFAQVVMIAGMAPVLMYGLYLANGYALTRSLSSALVVILAVPIQIAVSVFFFGGRSIWLFFAEDAAVEVGAFVLETLAAAIIKARSKEGWKTIVFILVFAIPLFVGGSIPYMMSVWRGYGGTSLWLLIFATSFVTTFSEYAKLYSKLIRAHDRTGELQEVMMQYDGGWIARLVGLKSDTRVIRPFEERYKNKLVRGWPIILGFVSFFLPYVAMVILEITKK
jgi:uncharacterized protein (DUF697 family)